MTPSPPLRALENRPGWGRWVGALLGAGVGWACYWMPWAHELTRWSFDVPCLFRNSAPPDMLLVYLDDETKRVLSEPLDAPLPLAYHRKLLNRLREGGARLIVYDILFDWPEADSPETLEFARIIGESSRVVLVAAATAWSEMHYHFQSVLMPLSRFREAACAVGLARLRVDPDQAVRQIDPGTETLTSVGWAAAQALQPADPLGQSNQWSGSWLNYVADPTTIASLKMETILGEATNHPDRFRNKVVVVGAGPSVGVAGLPSTLHRTPYSRWGGPLAPATSLHALTLDNLWRSGVKQRPSTWIEGGLWIALGASLGLVLTALRGWALMSAGLGAAIVLILAGCGLHWGTRYWVAWAIPLAAQLPVTLVWATLFQALCDFRDRGVLLSTLSLHFSPARVREILRHPDRHRPGASRREVSLLMTDIQSFSKVTALMHPEDLIALINEYYERTIECVYRTEGTVMDLVGDSIMALWNAPEAQLDHRERACRTALMLQQVLRDFDAANPGLPLRTRIGLHAGTVWVGNIGSTRRFDYAALGEAVNLVARLQALNKPLGTSILATRDIQRVAANVLATRLVGHFAFEGIDQPVEILEVLGPRTSATEKLSWLISFAQALHHFQRRQFAAADRGFAEVLEAVPTDGPSRFYRDQIQTLQRGELPADWIGVIRVDGK